jgi:hypothetical protein
MLIAVKYVPGATGPHSPEHDPDDPQKVSWVSLSERDSFLGRMLAHFSLLVMPGEPLSH